MFLVISGTKLCLDPTYHTWLQSASIDGHFDTHKGGVWQHFIFDFPYSGLKLVEASALVWLGIGGWGWWRLSSVGTRPYIFHAHFKQPKYCHLAPSNIDRWEGKHLSLALVTITLSSDAQSGIAELYQLIAPTLVFISSNSIMWCTTSLFFY